MRSLLRDARRLRLSRPRDAGFSLGPFRPPLLDQRVHRGGVFGTAFRARIASELTAVRVAAGALAISGAVQRHNRQVLGRILQSHFHTAAVAIAVRLLILMELLPLVFASTALLARFHSPLLAQIES